MDAYIVAIVSYMIGSVPFAVIISNAYGLGDITRFGSGNPGATNMTRMAGPKWGAINLTMDALKGFIAVAIFGTPLAFAAAVFGHCFSPFLKFNGGKGVATTMGGLLALDFTLGIFAILTWLIAFFAFRISAVSAIIAVNLSALVAWAYWPNLALGISIVAILVTAKHHSNIKKLLKKKED